MQYTDLTFILNLTGPSAFTSVVPGAAANTCPVAIVASDSGEGVLTGDFKHERGSSVQTSFYCAWADRNNLASYLLYANSQSVGGYQIQLGSAHWIYPTLYCDDVKISPVGNNIPNTNANYQYTWTFARLDCTFTPQVFNFGSPAVLREESIGVSGEVISIPSQTITVSGTPTTNPQSIYYPLLRYSVKIMNVLTLPLASMLTCMNTVNSTNLVMQLGGGNTETVSAEFALYEGFGETKRTITLGGVAKWDVTHTWLISPINFNYVLNPAAISGSVKITTPYGVNPDVFVRPDQVIYQQTDHAGILGV